jgi:hypothetical protein
LRERLEQEQPLLFPALTDALRWTGVWLVARGVKPSDVAALYVPDSVEFVALRYTASRAGAVLVRLSPFPPCQPMRNQTCGSRTHWLVATSQICVRKPHAPARPSALAQSSLLGPPAASTERGTEPHLSIWRNLMRILHHRVAGPARPAAGRSGGSALRLLAPPWLAVAAGLAAAGAVIAVPAAALAAPGPQPVTGHVYLDDNTAGSNTIAAFDRHPDGTLTPEPGSPFTAGGAGTGAGLASEGAIQIAGGGRFLLAVDAGSNQVSVEQILPGGTLRLSDTVPSGGVLPVSIAVHGSLVYVANAGPADTDYTGFRLSPQGTLTPLPGSTVPLPSAAQPGDVLFNSTGTRLVGTRVGTSQIDSFTVGHDGRLTAAPGSPFTAQGTGPFGSQFRTASPGQLFVTNAHNGTGLGTVSAFADSPDGTLTPIGSSPYADQQTAPCWLTVSPDGRHLFAVNTGSGTISRYAIAPGGQLTLLGSTTVAATAGVGAVDPGISPDGRYLYLNESRAGTVGAFAVTGGTLTKLPSSPTALPVGATPAGIAVS